MHLLVVRHAIAEDRADWAPRPDPERPLTGRGARRMARAVRGLRRAAPVVDAVLASPLTRARQTAEIIGSAYGVESQTLASLEPGGSADEVIEALLPFASLGVVAVVGHEPDLSTLVGAFLSGQRASFVRLKKGGACLLEFDQTPAAANGVLLWALTPRQLRRLGD